MSKRKKRILIILIVFLALLAVLFIGAYGMFRSQLTAMKTIRKLDDRLYTLDYVGDYGFDEFQSRGGASSDSEVGSYIAEFLSHGFYKVNPDTANFGCSTVLAPSDNGYLFGRNYDWVDCTIMIVRTKPENGYASVSTCNMDYLGFGEDYLPEGFQNQMLALASVYVPLDGMNEMGLCVADLMIEVNEVTNQDNGKVDLTTTTAIRKILDEAKDVDEAIEILKNIDMHGSAGLMHHLALCDKSGRSVVAEYIDNELIITETPIVTNFFLTEGEKYGIGTEQSKLRYSILSDFLSENATADSEDMRDALKSVCKKTLNDENEKTVWSIVCDPNAGTLTYYIRENYEEKLVFPIREDK